MLEMILRPLNLEVHMAQDGQSALEIARKTNPDLILLDVMMPGMDGFHVCRELRRDFELADVPIILVTALGDEDSFQTGMNAGADDFITKPIDPMLLKTRVRTITRLNRYRGLRQERYKFQWVMEHTKEGYLVLSDNMQVVYANMRAQKLLDIVVDTGMLPSERPRFREVVDRQYNPHPSELWSDWPDMDAQQTPFYLVRPEQPGSPSIWLQVEKLEIPPRAGEKYFIRLRDVTKTVHENQLIWSFHDIVSHKFQTPLSLLVGFLDMLRERRLEPDQEEKLVNAALKNARRLQKEVNSIFRYMAATTDSINDSPTYTSLEEVIKILVRIQTNMAIPRVGVNNRLKTDLSLVAISLTPTAAESVFRELLQNAVKFHPDSRPKVKITLAQSDGSVVIQIEDDGPGLRPEYLDRIWVPYFQAEENFYGETPGLGLGLAIVAILVVSAGGVCRSKNREEGRGLIVELELPTRRLSPIPSG